MEGYFLDALLDPARLLVESAATLYKSDKAAALQQLSNPEGNFVYGQHYVYVLDSTGVMIAHGVNPGYVGQDFYAVADPDGKHFVQEILETANREGHGIVEYKWLDPATGTERPKTVFFMKTNGAIICSGVYGANPARDILDLPADEDGEPRDTSPELEKFRKMQPIEAAPELLPDDAVYLVQKAIAFFKLNGKDIALAEFSSRAGRFVTGEQYVFVLDSTGRMLAHGITAEYVGKDFYRTVDSNGKAFIKEIVDTANSVGSGWVEYRWYNPVTRREQLKTVYFEKPDGVIICSGIYAI